MRAIISLVIDIIAVASALVVSAVAFQDMLAGIVGAVLAALYGMWNYWNGITPRR